MIRSAQELQDQATLKSISFWNVHNCSMCGYPCGFHFSGDEVRYDSGCDCVNYGPVLTEKDWDYVAGTYNRNQPENNPDISSEYLDKVNAVWQFESPELITK